MIWTVTLVVATYMWTGGVIDKDVVERTYTFPTEIQCNEFVLQQWELNLEDLKKPFKFGEPRTHIKGICLPSLAPGEVI